MEPVWSDLDTLRDISGIEHEGIWDFVVLHMDLDGFLMGDDSTARRMLTYEERYDIPVVFIDAGYITPSHSKNPTREHGELLLVFCFPECIRKPHLRSPSTLPESEKITS